MRFIRALLTIVLITLVSDNSFAQGFKEAADNGKRANEGFRRCMNYTLAWLAEADSTTKLIPRNLKDSRDFWNAYDAAADNYAFMVLTASLMP